MALNLNLKKNVFLPCYRPYITDYSKRYNVFYGGRGSGKTIFVYQKLLLKGLKEKRTILLMRKTTASCKFSVWKELKEAVNRFQLTKYFTFYESDYSAVCNLNGTVFKCSGLDIAEKIKGFSEISDVLLEEATEFTLEDFDLIDGTVRSIKYNLPLQIYCLFNPVSKQNWVYKKFGFDTGIAPPDTFILKTTYLDNPHLSPDYIKRMENMRITNPNRWKIEALGDFVTLEGLVITNWREEEFDHMALAASGLEHRCGMDVGWTDPSAIIDTLYDRENKIIYVFNEFYKSGCQLSELAQAIIDMNLKKSKLYVDAAEPRTVAYFKSVGINAYPCAKGKDSVKAGLMFLQDHLIIVHPSCQNFITELENFSYIKSKQTGEWTEDTTHEWSHAIDACRYAYSDIYTNKKLKTVSKAAFGL